LRTPAAQIAEAFGVLVAPDVKFRYNIAPSQQVCVVRLAANDVREAALMRWAFVPP
jgi:putative SOS response-associated peptidase YedK